jgi:hypothetical protein
MDESETQPFVDAFDRKTGEFPIKHLGIPLHYEKLRRADIQPLVDMILKFIAGWRGRQLSYGGRLTFIKSCLATHLSAFLL